MSQRDDSKPHHRKQCKHGSNPGSQPSLDAHRINHLVSIPVTLVFHVTTPQPHTTLSTRTSAFSLTLLLTALSGHYGLLLILVLFHLPLIVAPLAVKLQYLFANWALRTPATDGALQGLIPTTLDHQAGKENSVGGAHAPYTEWDGRRCTPALPVGRAPSISFPMEAEQMAAGAIQIIV